MAAAPAGMVQRRRILAAAVPVRPVLAAVVARAEDEIAAERSRLSHQLLRAGPVLGRIAEGRVEVHEPGQPPVRNLRWKQSYAHAAMLNEPQPPVKPCKPTPFY